MTSSALKDSSTTSGARIAGIAFGAVVGVLGLAYAADVAMSSGELPRGTRIAGVSFAGVSRAEAAARLEQQFGALATQPIAVRAADVATTVEPGAAGLSLDVEATLDSADSQALNPLTRVKSFFGDTDTALVAKVDTEALRGAVRSLAARQVDRGPREGAIVFEGVTPRAVMPHAGRKLDVEESAARIAADYLRATGPVELDVAVTPVKTTEESVRRALADIAQPAVAAPVVLTAPGKRLAMTPAQVASSLVFAPDASGALVPSIEPKALDQRLRTTLAQAESAPRDADFNLVDGKVAITPSATGKKVDAAALARDLLPALARPAPREVALTIVNAEPKLSTERARTLGIKEAVGTFTTYHPCCRPRVQNIHRIADMVDGAVVLPGETFSLNGHVGERTRGKGFVEAPMILNGRFVDAVGGGVSQFATTMFNAVFFSGMQDVYHKAHSYYISRYPAGREATVSAPAPDLKWRNDSPYGVLVKTAYTDKSITVTFWSTKRYDIESISGPRTRVRGYPTKYEYGRNCSSMGGAQGFDISVWRVFKQNGKEIKRERFFTRYLPEPRVICNRRPASSSPRPSPSPSPSPSSSPRPAPSPSPSGG